MTRIQEAAERLIKRHGSLRKAGRAVGIHYAYLQRLAKGGKVNPSGAVLKILGLQQRVTYVRKGNGS